MKLSLMALAIEISLARLFVSSWGSAVATVLLFCTLALAIVLLYCTLVYVFKVRKVLASKKEKHFQYKNWKYYVARLYQRQYEKQRAMV